MDRHAGTFAGCVQARHRLLGTSLHRRHHLPETVGGYAAHAVVRGRVDRDRTFNRIDAGKSSRQFTDTRQALFDHLFTQVIDLDQDVIFFRTATAALLHLGVNRARDHVARRQVLGVRRVAFHKALAATINEVAAFAAHAFRDQDTNAGDTGWVKLHELHILQRNTGAQRHGHTVAGVDVGIGGGPVYPSGPTGGQQRRLGLDQQRFAGLDLDGHGTETVAVGVHDQVEDKVFIKEMRACLQVLLVQGMQHGVAGTISGGAGARRLLAAVVLALTAEGALVDASAVQARERHAEMLQLDHQPRGGAAHVFDRVLIAEIIAALDGVVHMPVPVVRRHVGQRRIDAALGGNRMRSGREDFGHHRHVRLGLRQLQRGAQAAATGADNKRIETTPRDAAHGPPPTDSNSCTHHSAMDIRPKAVAR